MAMYMHYANVTFLSQEFIYTAIAKRYYYFSNVIAWPSSFDFIRN